MVLCDRVHHIGAGRTLVVASPAFPLPGRAIPVHWGSRAACSSLTPPVRLRLCWLPALAQLEMIRPMGAGSCLRCCGPAVQVSYPQQAPDDPAPRGPPGSARARSSARNRASSGQPPRPRGPRRHSAGPPVLLHSAMLVRYAVHHADALAISAERFDVSLKVLNALDCWPGSLAPSEPASARS